MSYQEVKNYISLFSSLVIFGCYSLYVYQQDHIINIESSDTFRFWGAFILILIPVTIVAKVVIEIVFRIIYRITTKEVEPTITDELDQLIELKSIRVSHVVFVFGFLLAMVSLVIEMPYSTMFIILISAGLLSEMASVITQIYHYRKGV